ncbi:hypothetical protein ABB37_02453 [Leptomonas pyrrhocoris]|uniref:Uncharacterized protein n=1 Tax=Leptomonas pyrrhocoris TaxID=157538 RepID=A0A0N0VGA2_LEPPY|nr:hypothetical protein ABB37_02453 [Leptomonas pyrrhocoris]XP_015661038.1 hypothetical protein ABB37_02453 [Leptomonas pyrrhocoris]KPA82598.1 hypothetical protein ABB37_02453 [Leptomonas pyrrhocoris]KPA82599.1 hypothetical protein ABB37_02453 [Leptomonas pyrrhocoris]|eukprot:XP_015661037.1 hypothetical protein ABB37_02453 [Leptomonas pyrrhocoris]
MNSESKSSGPKQDARQPPKGRNSPKPQTGNSSGAPADRPQRRRDNERREGGEKRDGGERRERRERRERPERQERGERPERGDRQERPRRPQVGQPAGADKSKSAAEEKAHGPVVYVKGDIASGSTWAKNGSGPSFADMVRQNASVVAEKTSSKNTPPPAKQSPPAQQQQQQQHQPRRSRSRSSCRHHRRRRLRLCSPRSRLRRRRTW